MLRAISKDLDMIASLFPPGYFRSRMIGGLSLILTASGSMFLSVILSQNWRLHTGSGLPAWKEHGIYGTGIILIAGVVSSLAALAIDHERDCALLSLCLGIFSTCTLGLWIFLL